MTILCLFLFSGGICFFSAGCRIINPFGSNSEGNGAAERGNSNTEINWTIEKQLVQDQINAFCASCKTQDLRQIDSFMADNLKGICDEFKQYPGAFESLSTLVMNATPSAMVQSNLGDRAPIMEMKAQFQGHFTYFRMKKINGIWKFIKL